MNLCWVVEKEEGGHVRDVDQVPRPDSALALRLPPADLAATMGGPLPR